MILDKMIVLACVTFRPYVSRETTQTGSLGDVTVTLLTVLRTRCGTVISVVPLSWATCYKIKTHTCNAQKDPLNKTVYGTINSNMKILVK